MVNSFRKIFVLHNGSLGDLLLSLPALCCIREGSDFIHIAGQDDPVRLLRSLGCADGVTSSGDPVYAPLYGGDTDKNTADFLRQFGTAYYFSRRVNPDVIRALTKIIPKVYGILTVPLERTMHVSDYQIHQLKDCRAKKNVTLFSDVPQSIRERATAVLFESGISVGRKPLITIHPGSGGKEKNWPPERFAELISMLVSYLDVFLVLLTGPAEETWQQTMVLKYSGEVTQRIGVFSSPDLELAAGILSLSAVYIGNDSGITHLASLVNNNTIALFGPTDSALWAPVGRKTRILVSGLNCAPCGEMRRMCIMRDCLTAIRTETVYQEVLRMLGRDILQGGYGISTTLP